MNLDFRRRVSHKKKLKYIDYENARRSFADEIREPASYLDLILLIKIKSFSYLDSDLVTTNVYSHHLLRKLCVWWGSISSKRDFICLFACL